MSRENAGGPRTPFLAACGACRHVWPAAWLPMPLADAGRLLLKTSCPSCAAPPKQIFIPTKAQADAWHAGQAGDRT